MLNNNYISPIITIRRDSIKNRLTTIWYLKNFIKKSQTIIDQLLICIGQ